MAKLLIGTANPSFVPDIDFLTEEGGSVSNVELPEADQVRIYHRYCDDETAHSYLSKKKGIKMREIVKDFCNKIDGLSEVGIKNGVDLIAAERTDITLDLIEQTFKHVTRFNKRSKNEAKEDD